MHYGTLSDALAYHTARANAAWLAEGVTDPQRTAALLRASVWLDGVYADRFPGTKTGGRAQERAWPRVGASDIEGIEIPDDEVPREVEQAAYEAGLRELVSPGSLNPDVVPGAIKTRVRVEGAVDVTYAEGAGAEGQIPVVTVIDGILSSILRPKKSATIVGFAARA